MRRAIVGMQSTRRRSGLYSPRVAVVRLMSRETVDMKERQMSQLKVLTSDRGLLTQGKKFRKARLIILPFAK